MISYHYDVRSGSFFTQLTNLRQRGAIIEHIQQCQELCLQVDGILDDKLLDLLIGTLKDNIKLEVHIFEPTSLEKEFMLARKVESKNLVMATRRTISNTSRENNVPYSNPPQLTRMKTQQMDERIENVLYFNCDHQYTKVHKCGDKILFYIDCEEEEEENEQEPSQAKDIQDINSKEITPAISYHALYRISTQKLKIEGYIKKKKVTTLIDSSSTHNFIHYKLAKVLNYVIYLEPKFQVMIVDGGTINFSGKCHKIILSMGEYVLNSQIIAITIRCVDVIMGPMVTIIGMKMCQGIP